MASTILIMYVNLPKPREQINQSLGVSTLNKRKDGKAACGLHALLFVCISVAQLWKEKCSEKNVIGVGHLLSKDESRRR